MNQKITQQLSQELARPEASVQAVITLLDEGSTVPFIARYRKEHTGGMSDTELRHLVERLDYLRELEARRATILHSIAEQGKLTDALARAVQHADNKATLEDVYLPFKPKRRTKAQLAREAGLAPLAEAIFSDPNQQLEQLAEKYLNPEHQIDTIDAALQGAQQILLQQFSEAAELLGDLREYCWLHAHLQSQVIPGKENEAQQFRDYFAAVEGIAKVPSHRALAMLRGQREGFLRLKLDLNDAMVQEVLRRISKFWQWQESGRAADAWLAASFEQTWKVKLFPKLEMDLLLRLREQADTKAIQVFAENLKNLLLAPPAGSKVVMGLDPGFRTGVKVALVNETGKLLDFGTIFPHQPKNAMAESLSALRGWCTKHQVNLISIGNGTASRETDRLCTELIKRYPELGLTKVVVSEAGASVYSASELAASEFPDVDVSFRGAVSIARRLQDPLAELVKIDPKAIGVGQYQHDVNQVQLAKALDAIVEDCVNVVGVDANRASVSLLAHVAGLNHHLAEQIVLYRDQHGAFPSRAALQAVPRFGPKTFEQAAGFLRILDGEQPLDCSGVHPEAYPLVTRILADKGWKITDLIGHKENVASIKASDYLCDQFGLPTIQDILHELEKPGRDPRPEFQVVQFQSGVEVLSDLSAGMQLQGVVTNVTDFGAFVDIGVHQDGLVHKSELANYFVKDPKQVVRVGQIVQVRVLKVDAVRKRIQLSMRAPVTPKTTPKPVVLKPKRPKKIEPPRDSRFAKALSAAWNSK